MKSPKLLVAVLLAVLAAGCTQNASQDKKQKQDLPVYLDDSKDIEARVEDALSRMTLEEKIAVLHAQSKFSSAGVPRLGIPEVWMSDGPHGIRADVLWDRWKTAGQTNDSIVGFPALTCLAATWEPADAALYGKVVGEEARYRKKDMLLGPGVNIYRHPLNGRNFEYFGEDPYLASVMVVPYIQGVQSNGVGACVKHYILNDQEHERFKNNVIVDDRAFNEIYLPPFKAAVQKGGTWGVMPAYNQYKGVFLCENDTLLNKVLKEEWGFDGVAVSDWGGTHSTLGAVYGGLDMEFATNTDGQTTDRVEYWRYYMANPYLNLVKEGKAGTKELDDKVRRILRLIFRTNMNRNRPWGSICSPEHFAAARKIATDGIVLLKNEGGLLPIDTTKVKKVLVVGENAIKMMTVGGGSSSLKAKKEYIPLEGLQNRLQHVCQVVYERGYVGDTITSFDGVYTGQSLVDNRPAAQLISAAVEAAKDADYVIFFGGLNKSAHQDAEGGDREQYELPYGQDAVVEALAEANPHIVFVNISGNAVAMPWIDKVPAVVQGWYLGSEAGEALADVLVGDVNPSGKLPFSFAVKLDDYGSIKLGDYPGTKRADSDIWDIRYNESIYVGYRWFDKEQIKTLFPFGHGLSYTTFEYGEPQLSGTSMGRSGKVTLKVKVTNTGSRDGAEVVQLYISDKESSLPRPPKELKGFKKVYLKAGETKEVSFDISSDMLQYYDDARHEWVAEPGAFEALVAASAEDVRGRVSFDLK